MTRRPRRRRRLAKKRVGRTHQIGLVFSIVLAGVLAVTAGWMYEGPGPKARLGASTEVILPQKAGVTKIAGALGRAGVIHSPAIFVIAAELTGAAPRLKAGDYVIRSEASMAQIMRMIRAGAVARHFLTIPEGLSSQAVADILASRADLTGPADLAPEGSILPETYEVRRGETRAAVIGRMRAAQTDLLADLWSRRAANLPFKTPDEAVTLASIVEKETAKADERPRIAAVFINRLGKGMRLETDPTVIYGLTGGRPLGHGLRVSELAKRTAYNTYQVAGLPPTPIGNPGKASLVAALNPDKTDDLYFVADGTGGHVFAATFEEHQHNVAKWRTIEQARARAGAQP